MYTFACGMHTPHVEFLHGIRLLACVCVCVFILRILLPGSRSSCCQVQLLIGAKGLLQQLEAAGADWNKVPEGLERPLLQAGWGLV